MSSPIFTFDGTTVRIGAKVLESTLRTLAIPPADPAPASEGPSPEEQREAAVRHGLGVATGLSGQALTHLREALRAVGDPEGVQGVRVFGTEETIPGAHQANGFQYVFVRGAPPAAAEETRGGRRRKGPPLVKVIRAGDKPKPPEGAAAPGEPEKAAPLVGNPPKRVLPQGRGRFVTAGKISGMPEEPEQEGRPPRRSFAQDKPRGHGNDRPFPTKPFGRGIKSRGR